MNRLFVLPLASVGLFALVWSPPGARPVPPELRPTPRELAEARAAYAALGGRHQADEFRGRVYHKFFAPLAALDKLPDPSFEYALHIAVRPTTPKGALAPLARLKHLRRVSLERDHRYYDDDFDPRGPIDLAPFVSELAAVPNLEHLSVWEHTNNHLTDAVAEAVARLPALKSVVGQGPITDAGVAHLARCTQLESVALQMCPNVTDAGLAPLAALPHLRALIVQDCARITAAGIRHFTFAPRLHYLAIGGRDAREDVFDEVGRIVTLERLNLTTFPKREMVTDRALVNIGQLVALRELIGFKGNGRFTDVGLRALGRLPVLEELNLMTQLDATDEGFAALAGAKTLRRLELGLAHNLTDVGLARLADLPHLREFVLRRAPRVTDGGLAAFAERRGPQLEVLALPETGGDETVTAQVRNAPHLRVLSLRDCAQLTDRGAALAARLPALDTISFPKGVSKGAASAFHVAAPRVHVTGP